MQVEDDRPPEPQAPYLFTSSTIPKKLCDLSLSVKTKVKSSHLLLTRRSCEVMLVSSKSCGAQDGIAKISWPD
jgi:hypothetical protein